MPQMMPINWMMIFFMCLICLIMIIILMNFMFMYFKMGNVMSKPKDKKWNWFW